MTGRYEFIDAEYAEGNARPAGGAPTITCMCRWLGVSKSGFYEWRSRPESASAERRRKLKLVIRRIFDDSDSTYGYRRIAAELARRGVAAGAELVRRLMRELGLTPCQATAVASVHDPAGPGGPGPGPSEPRLRRRGSGRQDGRRHYLFGPARGYVQLAGGALAVLWLLVIVMCIITGPGGRQVAGRRAGIVLSPGRDRQGAAGLLPWRPGRLRGTGGLLPGFRGQGGLRGEVRVHLL